MQQQTCTLDLVQLRLEACFKGLVASWLPGNTPMPDTCRSYRGKARYGGGDPSRFHTTVANSIGDAIVKFYHEQGKVGVFITFWEPVSEPNTDGDGLVCFRTAIDYTHNYISFTLTMRQLVTIDAARNWLWACLVELRSDAEVSKAVKSIGDTLGSDALEKLAKEVISKHSERLKITMSSLIQASSCAGK